MLASIQATAAAPWLKSPNASYLVDGRQVIRCMAAGCGDGVEMVANDRGGLLLACTAANASASEIRNCPFSEAVFQMPSAVGTSIVAGSVRENSRHDSASDWL